MAKTNLKIKLISDEENLDLDIVGIKEKNKIIYKENNILVTLNIYDNKIEMNRKCNEYNIDLIFIKDKATVSTYNVFGMSKVFDLNTKTKNLSITDKQININYELEGNDFSYSLLIGGKHDN